MAELKVLTAGKLKDDEYPIYADGEQVAVVVNHSGFARNYWKVHYKDVCLLTLPRKYSKAEVLKALEEHILGEAEKLHTLQTQEEELSGAMFSAGVKGYGYAVQVMKVEREKVSKQNGLQEKKGVITSDR